MRKPIAVGIDPGDHHQRLTKWVAITAKKKLTRLEQDVFPWIGKPPIHELKTPVLLSVLRRIESRGANELARRVRQIMGQIFRYAIATGRAERDLTFDLRDALPPAREKHHAAITEPEAVGALMREIEGFRGETVTEEGALPIYRFAPY